MDEEKADKPKRRQEKTGPSTRPPTSELTTPNPRQLKI